MLSDQTLFRRMMLVVVVMVASAAIVLYGKAVETGESHHQTSPTLTLTHELKGDDLYLQLKVTGFVFSLENMGKENKHGEGHVHLYLDGKKVAKIFDNQFVYRDIPAGRHQVMVELAHNNHESYGVAQSFQINVKGG